MSAAAVAVPLNNAISRLSVAPLHDGFAALAHAWPELPTTLTAQANRPKRLIRPQQDSAFVGRARCGRLTFRGQRRNLGGRLYSRAICDCFRSAWYDWIGLKIREHYHAGCLLPGCDKIGPPFSLVLGLAQAAELQWRAMLANQFQNVDNDWGGRLYPELETSQEGQANFCHWLRNRCSTAGRCWWVYRIDKESPWTDWNLSVDDTMPDWVKNFFPEMLAIHETNMIM